MADTPTFEQTTLLVSRRGISVFEPQNLLETTLAPAGTGTAPFTPRVWPNPRVRTPAPVGWVFQGVIVDEELLPFRPEWGNPPPAPRRPTLTIAQARPGFYAEGTPFHQDRWGTPLRLKTPTTFDPPNLLQSTLAPVAVTLPFSQSDWPVVRRVARPTLTIAAGRPFYFDEGKPPHQDVWPTPPRLRTPTLFEPQSLLEGLLAPTVETLPFAQAEWPVVLPTRRPTLTLIQARPAYYDEGKPNHQDAWPNPGLKRTGTGWLQARPFYYEEPVPPTQTRGSVTVSDAAVTTVTLDVS